MTVKCGDCKYFVYNSPEWREFDEQEFPNEGSGGRCAWSDTIKIPYAWRYSRREVMGVYSLEPIECDTFTEIEKT